MRSDDCYALLGVSRHASPEVLKRAFRSTILSTHPDRNPNDALAAERTREVVEAYRTITRSLAQRQPAPPPAQRACPAASVRYRTSPAYGQWIAQWALSALTIVLLVCTTLWLVNALASDQTPLHGPCVSEISCPQPPARLASIVNPDISNALEWYAAQEYQLGLASAATTSGVTEAYSEAARRSAVMGDYRSAHFYRTSLRDIETSRTSVLRLQN